MTTQTIASRTRSSVRYTVVLSKEGKAVSCTCTAGRYGNHCTHRALAELSGPFRKARASLEKGGYSRAGTDALYGNFLIQREGNAAEALIAFIDYVADRK